MGFHYSPKPPNLQTKASPAG
ncbi:hypothetical protein CCACVL1_08913 [Corchorus capsularis]|uniref:Uncharacterized protein n=1 Tax=Corchorus capsularis TaxID=210143 RepID=A0A1R3IYG5_COCAP|nr:hypothetical protein CCACVL1_08913 [Corchorus capsularis]